MYHVELYEMSGRCLKRREFEKYSEAYSYYEYISDKCLEYPDKIVRWYSDQPEPSVSMDEKEHKRCLSELALMDDVEDTTRNRIIRDSVISFMSGGNC